MKTKLYILLLYQSMALGKIWFISLGTHCLPASVLRALELRDAAFPFDWNITKYEALYKHFKYGFRSFLKKPLKLRADGEGITDQ
jgi:hypothetical protein